MGLPLLVWLLLSLIWGSTWLFIKLGLEDLPPITFAGIRFLLASVPLMVLLVARRVQLPRSSSDWWTMIITGLLTITLTYGLVFWGESFISSGLTAILFTVCPLITLIFAHFYVPNESLTMNRLGGILLGIGGVALIYYQQIQQNNEMAFWGSLAIFGSALASAISGIIVKNRANHIDPTLMTTVQMVTGFIPLLAIGIPLEGNPFEFQWTPLAIGALFYLAIIGSALPFVLLYWLIKHMDVTHTMLISMSSTLVAVLLGWLVLDETLGWHTLIGGSGLLIGLFLTMRKSRAKTQKTLTN